MSELYRVVQWSDDLGSSGVEFLYDEHRDVVLVPVEPCVHGKYDAHEVIDDCMGVRDVWECPGAELGGNDG